MRVVRALPALAVLAIVQHAIPAADGLPPVRGITLSTHTDGRDWADDTIVPALEEIRALGANWVTIHPYARIRADGSVVFRPIDPERPPEHLARPIREAHRLGLEILIKPHLAYWGSPFRWRGEIEFDDPANEERFWRDYERWIVSLAAATRDADGFVVGTELDRTLDREQRWREIIARVREVTPAPLTYAANWPDYERVAFWDALDVIGIQAYFPLTRPGDLSDAAIRAGWRDRMERLQRYSVEQGRFIVFTELGYNASYRAPVEPWDGRNDGEETLDIQESCMRAALDAIAGEPRVIGAFLWKWFPPPRSAGRNFRLATPRMKTLIRERWISR